MLKLKIAVPKQHAPVIQVWSAILALIRTRRQRARDRRTLARMNDHSLRDIGHRRSSYNPVDRAR